MRALWFSVAVVSISFIALGLFLFSEDFPGHNELKGLLIKRLIRVEPLTDNSSEPGAKSEAVIYVLGGGGDSLKNKFRTAAELYNQGLSKRILVLSTPGITEFDPLLGRNLTNNEWAVKNLVSFGVNKKDIEPVFIKGGYFGTLSEAKGIAAIAEKRGYKHLILVTSHFHTLRTWLTFSKMLAGSNRSLHIYASEASIRLHHLLLEYVKLWCYKIILLPVYTPAVV